METTITNGVKIMVFNDGETMMDKDIWDCHLVAWWLPIYSHYYVVKNRYGDGVKKMYSVEEFNQLKEKLVETYGVKPRKLQWHNARNAEGNSGWEAFSCHIGRVSKVNRRYAYFATLKNDQIIWENYSSASFKIPNTFLSYQVDEMKDICQICEDTFDNSI